MSKIVLEKWHGHYVLRDNQFTSENDYLLMLKDVLTDGGMSPSHWVKPRLIDPNRKGITGNATDITIKGNKVFIEPLFGEDRAQYRIEIDRQVLLKVIDDWEEIVKKRPDEIIMTQDKQGNITFEGIFKDKSEIRK